MSNDILILLIKREKIYITPKYLITTKQHCNCIGMMRSWC